MGKLLNPDPLGQAKGQQSTPRMPPQMVQANAACIELLEKVLEDARAGNVISVGVVACGPSDFGQAFAGPDAPRLITGLEVMKRSILDAIAPSFPEPKKSPIILRGGRP